MSNFGDAEINKNATRDYGQTGIVSGIGKVREQGQDIFHLIDWCSNKQRIVSYSPYGSEILACANTDDRVYYSKTAVNSIFENEGVKNELFNDSRCLYDTIATLHEGEDYRLRPTVQRMRNSLETQELNAMR